MAAVLAFLLTFFVIGNSLRLGLLGMLTPKLDAYPRLGRSILDTLISIVFTSILVITLGYLWAIAYTGIVLVIAVVISDLVSIVRESTPDLSISSQNQDRRETRIGMFLPPAICVIVGVAIILWRFSWLTWPEAFGQDIFIHLTAAQSITEYGGFSTLFPGYSLGFHAILSSIAIMAGLDPYPILAYGVIVTYPISLMLTYLLCKAISMSKLMSLMASILIPFVGVSGALLGPQYLLPSTYAYTVTILIILALDLVPRTTVTQSVAFLSYLTAIVVYPYMVMGTLPAVVYFWNRRAISGRVNRIVATMILWVPVIGALSIIVYYLATLLLGQLDWTFALGWVSFTVGPSLSQEILILRLAYSPLQLLLLFVGVLSLAVYYRGLATDKENSAFDYRGLLLLTILYLVCFFLPVAVAFRFEEYGRPFFFLCMVTGAFAVVRAAKYPLGRFKRPGNLGKVLSRYAALAAVAAILVASAYPTAVAIDTEMRWETHTPHLDELQAFEWLKENMPERGYVLTDPTTGFIMNGFVLRNCSCSLITESGFYTLGKASYLWPKIYAFLNASSWDDTSSYDSISSYIGGVTYILISPRTSEWIWRQRNNNPIEFADYNLRLTLDDMAWAKFFAPPYQLVQQFGGVRILVRQEVSLYYFDSFDNLTGWDINAGNHPTTDGQIAQWTNSAHPTTWYHLYTDVPSFASQQDLYLEVKWRANTTDLWGRVFGFSQNGMMGNYAFYTEETTPLLYWSKRTWKLTDTPGYTEGPLKSISLGFQNEDTNWTLYLDEIRIYGVLQVNSTVAERTVEHNRDYLSGLEAWNAGADRLLKTGHQAERWRDSAHSAAVYQSQQPLEMKCISVSDSLGQYHPPYHSEFRLSNSFRPGVGHI